MFIQFCFIFRIFFFHFSSCSNNLIPFKPFINCNQLNEFSLFRIQSHVHWIFCDLPLEISIPCTPLVFPMPNVLFVLSIDDRTTKYLIRTCTYKTVIAVVKAASHLLTCSSVRIRYKSNTLSNMPHIYIFYCWIVVGQRPALPSNLPYILYTYQFLLLTAHIHTLYI